MTKRLVLLDAFAILFRSYFALPPMSAPDGSPTNAVYGFTRIILNVIDELQPDCLAIAYDSPGPSFRKDLYDLYKANRPEAPKDFIPQIPISMRIIKALNIPQYDKQGWEADDIIGTLTKQTSVLGTHETVVVTGDQDLFQLINDSQNIKVYIPGMRGRDSVLYDQKGVFEKLSVKPTQIIDYKALAGDSSDNIPGVRGVGPKTAVELLGRYGDLDSIYKAVEDQIIWNKDLCQFEMDKKLLDEACKSLKVKKAIVLKLLTQKKEAYLSQKLATIATNAPVTIDMETCKINSYDKTEVRNLFEELNFKSLLGRLPDDAFDLEVQEALF